MAEQQQQVTSGLVVSGIENAENLATRLCDNITTRRSVISMPSTIGPDQTGLIAAQKTLGSPYGTQGVITYEIEGADKRSCLQVMWYVPYYNVLREAKVNCNLGPESASRDIFDDLIGGNQGDVVLASDTAFRFDLGQQFEARAVMGDTGLATLAVHFSNRGNPKMDNPQKDNLGKKPPTEFLSSF